MVRVFSGSSASKLRKPNHDALPPRDASPANARARCRTPMSGSRRALSNRMRFIMSHPRQVRRVGMFLGRQCNCPFPQYAASIAERHRGGGFARKKSPKSSSRDEWPLREEQTLEYPATNRIDNLMTEQTNSWGNKTGARENSEHSAIK